MKKKLSALLLIIILVFQNNLSSFAASEKTIEILQDIEILEPFSQGFFAKEYTREDFAVTLAKMYFYEGNIEYSKDLAKDISGSSNKNYINYVLSNNILHTDANGNFNSSGSVTQEVALKGIVTVVGYDVLAELQGGAESDYFDVANKIGLLKGVKIDDKNNLTYENIANLVWNGLNSIPISNNNNVINNYSTFLEEKGITYADGRLLANESIGLEIEKTQSGYVNVDGSIIPTEKVIPDYLVGTDVKYYMKENANNEMSVISMVSQRNINTLTLNASEIENVTFGSSYVQIEYDNKKSVNVSYQAYLWLNGKNISINKDIFDVFDSGEITFVSTNGSSVYDYVHMTICKTAVIEGVDYDDYILYTKYYNEKVDLKNCNEDTIIYNGNEKIRFSDLEDGQVVSIVCDSFNITNGKFTYDYSNAGNVKIYTTDSTISGDIDYISNNSEISISGVEYEFSEYYKGIVSVENKFKFNVDLKSSYTFLLDFYGQIADYIINSDASTMQYGYIIKSGIENGLRGGLSIKLLNAEGKLVIYKVYKTFVLNGVGNVESNSTTINGVDLNKKQVIRYRLSIDKIKEIDTIEMTTGIESIDNSLSHDMELTDVYYNNACFGYAASATENSVIFVDHSSDDNQEDRNFEVINKKALYFKLYDVSFYDMNDMNEANCILVKENTTKSLAIKNKSYLIREINRSINNNGEYGYTFYLCGSDGLSSSFANESDLRVYTAIVTTDITLTEVDASDIYSVLSKGDVIRIQKNAFDEITSIERLYDYNKGVEMQNIPYKVGDYKWNLTVGNLYKTSKDTLNFNYKNNQENIVAADRYISNISGKFAQIPVYDVKTDKVTMVRDPRMLPTYSNGNKAKVFARFGYQELYDVFVYEY